MYLLGSFFKPSLGLKQSRTNKHQGGDTGKHGIAWQPNKRSQHVSTLVKFPKHLQARASPCSGSHTAPFKSFKCSCNNCINPFHAVVIVVIINRTDFDYTVYRLYSVKRIPTLSADEIDEYFEKDGNRAHKNHPPGNHDNIRKQLKTCEN